MLLLHLCHSIVQQHIPAQKAACGLHAVLPGYSPSCPACCTCQPAPQGALLLLLFRVSHLLEDRLTERAAGSLQRLFDSVPDTASIVEVDEGGAPRVATTQQVGGREPNMFSVAVVLCMVRGA
jgi:hypothetical protein